MAEDSDKGKRVAILSMVEGKALCKISRSSALFVPQLWLRLYGWEVDGKVWIKLEQKGSQIILSPIDRQAAEAMMEANDVKPC